MPYKTGHTVASGQNKFNVHLMFNKEVVFRFVFIHHIYLFLDSVYTGVVSQSSHLLHIEYQI